MSKLQNCLRWFFWSGFYLSLGSFGLLGCNRLPNLITTGASSDTAAVAAPAANMQCDTANHLAKVTTLQGQPRLTFGPKPDANTLTDASPVVVTENDDGSRTYSVATDMITYARFYLDGTCLVQVVAADNTVSVEESGKTSPVDPPVGEVASSSLEQPDQYQQGYDLGYKEGFQSGETFRRENHEILLMQLSQQIQPAAMRVTTGATEKGSTMALPEATTALLARNPIRIIYP